MFLNERTGEGVRVAVIDSGVHADHPHVGGRIALRIAIRSDGTQVQDVTDRLGHGTAVVAAIREKAPHATILAVKIFWDALKTDVDTLARGLLAAGQAGADVINLSLGTAEMKHRERLADAVLCARRLGAIVVAAHEDGGVLWLPGCLEGVVGVRADASIDRGTYDVRTVENRSVLVTSPYPRDIPGVPRERNLHGVSFAVANASAFVARAREQAPGADLDAVFAQLREGLCRPLA
jgi:Subtilase family